MQVNLPPSTPGRCLITGIGGFTGLYLAQELQAAGYEVFGTAHEASPLPKRVYSVDLNDLAGLRAVIKAVRPDVVVHLAAIAFVAHGDVEAIYRTNVNGTRNLLQALAESDHVPRAVLLASSANIYGNSLADPIREQDAVAPESDYAVSKIAMEYMARLWNAHLPITIVRPFNYTGVGQAANFLVPKIVSHFKQRAARIELGNLNVERDFSDVRSVVTAYRRLLDNPAPGEIFNICSGRVSSLRDIIDTLESLAGYTIEVSVNPAFVRPNEVKRLVGCNTKLVAAIGELPAIVLPDTLRWMLQA